jgi:hypothetical protein
MRRALLLLVLLTAAAGCGGGHDGPPDLDAGQVARGFARVTGDRLVGDPGAGRDGIQVLALATSTADATALQARYGSFSIFVVGDGDLGPLTSQDPGGDAVRPDARGIYWRRLSAAPPAWQAAKRYRNVVLQWEAGRTRATDARFDRLDAALSRLVDPRAPVRLPPQDTPCERLGIDPATHGTGTCKQGAQTVVVTTRGHRLRLPDVTVTRVRVQVAKRVGGGGSFGQRATARGRFVVVRFRAANHADQPVDRLAPVLAIGARRYASDTTAQLVLQARSPLPLQPGAGADIVAAYDVPVAAARTVRRAGSLLLVGDAGAGTGSIGDAAVVGRVRFGT